MLSSFFTFPAASLLEGPSGRGIRRVAFGVLKRRTALSAGVPTLPKSVQSKDIFAASGRRSSSSSSSSRHTAVVDSTGQQWYGGSGDGSVVVVVVVVVVVSVSVLVKYSTMIV